MSRRASPIPRGLETEQAGRHCRSRRRISGSSLAGQRVSECLRSSGSKKYGAHGDLLSWGQRHPLASSARYHLSRPMRTLIVFATLALSVLRRGVHARPRLAAAGRRAEGHGHQVHMDQQDLSRHGPRLLGLRPGAVQAREARLRDGVPGRAGVRQRRGRLAHADRLRQPDPEGRDAGHHRHLHQSRRAAGARSREAAEPLQPQLRIRRPERPLRALSDRGDPARGRQAVQAVARPERPRHRRRQFRRHRRLHRGLAAARRLPPRALSSSAATPTSAAATSIPT